MKIGADGIVEIQSSKKIQYVKVTSVMVNTLIATSVKPTDDKIYVADAIPIPTDELTLIGTLPIVEQTNGIKITTDMVDKYICFNQNTLTYISSYNVT